MRRLLPVLTLAAALPAAAEGLSDLHLTPAPRTPAETARIAAVTAPPDDPAAPQRFEAMPAGKATVRARPGPDAFSIPSASLDFEGEMRFKLGNGLFRRLWVSAPSSTIASDGLGPLYNARGCQTCHLRDGRGHPPEGPQDSAVSLLIRLSVPDHAASADLNDYLVTHPAPVYGEQLQDFAIQGQRAEGRIAVDWTEIPVALAGGETATLRRPVWRIEDPGFGPLPPDLMISPRVAPQMIGLGLLEAIPAADILALADPDDADGDGISGRPNLVLSVEFDRRMLGRFGWKAGVPTVRQQSAAAFAGDMGLSTTLFPAPWGDCTAAQAECRAAPHGDDAEHAGVEIGDEALDLVVHYSRNLGVPARRDIDDPQVLHGRTLFHAAGCAACHRPAFVTHRLPDRPEHSFQLIWPYTDLLLHDMGEGLADHRPEAEATGTEWRTPPLWGIGLTERVSGHATFLHDGRARSLLEAVLWHGGEAQAARDAVVGMEPADRAALVRFLESL